MELLIGGVLAGLVLLSISLQRAYAHLPIKELKRRARAQDETANLLYKAATYGVSLRGLLWFFIGLSSAGFFVYIARHVPVWFAVFLSGLVIWAGFVWLPSRETKQVSVWFAKTLAPAFAWLLQYLHTPLVKLSQFGRRISPISRHTGLYDKEDLLELINDQNEQADNQISQNDLELVFHALTFSDKLVADFLTPRRIVKAVSADESIGPVLMTELHASGFSRFPVYEGKKDHIVGTLFLHDLVNIKASAKVKDVMQRKVYYVHEDQNLADALQAILKSHHHLLVVVNSFEEYVGVITIEDVLEQIIGQPIIDEFDRYDDLRAVAERAASKEHAKHDKKEPEASEPTTEVIE